MIDLPLSTHESKFTILAMDSKKKFGKIVSEARTMRGILAKDLATRLGLAASTLSNIETGKPTYPPEPELLDQINKILGIPKFNMLVALGYLDEENQEQSPAQTLSIKNSKHG